MHQPAVSELRGRSDSRPCLLRSAVRFKIQIFKNVTSNAWRIKYKQNKKLITQFVCKLRDKSNKPKGANWYPLGAPPTLPMSQNRLN